MGRPRPVRLDTARPGSAGLSATMMSTSTSKSTRKLPRCCPGAAGCWEGVGELGAAAAAAALFFCCVLIGAPSIRTRRVSGLPGLYRLGRSGLYTGFIISLAGDDRVDGRTSEPRLRRRTRRTVGSNRDRRANADRRAGSSLDGGEATRARSIPVLSIQYIGRTERRTDGPTGPARATSPPADPVGNRVRDIYMYIYKPCMREGRIPPIKKTYVK